MSTAIGGQAVLEGVMMRTPSSWAVAVRKPDGKIAQVVNEIASPMAKRRIWRLPVIRGVIALGESLAIGFRALAISANYAAQEETKEGEEEKEVIDRALARQLIFAFAIAIGFAVLLFKVTPALITNWLPVHGTSGFVVVEGAIRVALFIGYLALISLLPDLRRVFQYHAAEHKAINCYEAGDELTPENVQRHSLIHVRCGTAFLLWVMVIAIFVFAFFGHPVWYWLIAHADPAAARDRRPRLRADPLRRQAREQPGRALAARARPLAPAPDHAAAEPRPARSLDPGAPAGAGAREQPRRPRPTGGGHGLSWRPSACEVIVERRADGAGRAIDSTAAAPSPGST